MEKAKFRWKDDTGKESSLDVLFNPESYSVDSSAEYSTSSAPGEYTEKVQFTKLTCRKLNLELYFDTLNTNSFTAAQDKPVFAVLKDLYTKNAPDVRILVQQLHKLMELTKTGGKTLAPPAVEFSWGSFSFNGVITSMHENYTMFQSNGCPVKATVSVSMQELNTKEPNAQKSAPSADVLDSDEMKDMKDKAEKLVKNALKKE